METYIKQEGIEHLIFQIRNQRVMIDRDLAAIFSVETKYINRQVKRNSERFPSEFMFQLNKMEKDELVTNWHRFASMKHSSSLPYAFSEHGIAMLSAVLNSQLAVNMSIHIIKTFIRIREIMHTGQILDQRISILEEKVDRQFSLVFSAIDALNLIKNEPMTPIGFKIKEQLVYFQYLLEMT
jgi:hypothetical protein